MGVGGFFMQGLASGFAQGQQIQEMNWQRREKERIKKEEDALMETLTMVGKKFSSYYTDYNVSEEERLEAIATWSALSYEAKGLLKGAYEGVMSYNKDAEEQSLATVKAYRESIDSLDFDSNSISEIASYYRGQIKSPGGLKYFDAMDSSIRKKKEAQQKQPQIERFVSPEGVTAKYPDATPKHTTQGWIPEFTAAKEGTPLSAKDNWAIDRYKSREITFDQLSKYMGTRITPENKTALEDKIAKAKQYGATNEEIKGMIVGGTSGGTSTLTPTASGVENIREDILNAETIEDARRINQNNINKYGDTSGIADVDKYWGEGQISYLNQVKTSIESLLVDRGDKGKWLNNKPMTQEEVGLEFEGEKPASEIYEILYKSYTEYIEKLKKLGIDVSQFPDIKALSEIDKVGGTEGFFAIGGVKKGDYKSIYK